MLIKRRPWGDVVSRVGLSKTLKPAPRCVIACSVLSRSRVDRASLSSFATMTTSSAWSAFSICASCGRSDRAPDIFSEKTLTAPAAFNAAS